MARGAGTGDTILRTAKGPGQISVGMYLRKAGHYSFEIQTFEITPGEKTKSGSPYVLFINMVVMNGKVTDTQCPDRISLAPGALWKAKRFALALIGGDEDKLGTIWKDDPKNPEQGLLNVSRCVGKRFNSDVEMEAYEDEDGATKYIAKIQDYFPYQEGKAPVEKVEPKPEEDLEVTFD